MSRCGGVRYNTAIIKNFSNISFHMGIILIFIRTAFYIIRGFTLNINEFIVEWEIISIHRRKIILVFIFDYMSLFFLSVVRLISGSVMIYSTSYISSEIFFRRFIGIVLRFVLSMFLLILSPNIISLLLGWDGLGVTSYLLVIFYQRKKSYNAGMITAITNRLGDVGILICIGWLFIVGDWTYRYLSSRSLSLNSLLVFILILSACTKRAQIPFSAWLPAAIAAPTPVSALVHSSTLVTAGVYLIVRLNFVFSNSNSTNTLLFIGIMTILLAGAAAMFEIDIKKIIALSTLRQLGVIIMILGAIEPLLSFFHLLSHAYFKAILFMCAGMVIHNIKDYQDIRKIRIISRIIPLTFRVMTVANLSLCGLPFLSGFYSKDMILEVMIISNINLVISILIIVATFFTVAYSCRMSFLLGLINTRKESIYVSDDRDKLMITGILFLFPFSIIGGINIIWLSFSYPPTIFLPVWLKIFVIFLIVRAISLSIFSLNNKKESRTITKNFIGLIWFFPLTFTIISNNYFISRGKLKVKISESRWTETALYNSFYSNSNKLNKYFDFIGNSYFLGSVIILLFILTII